MNLISIATCAVGYCMHMLSCLARQIQHHPINY